MEELTQLSGIAQYMRHPLVVLGIVLIVLFSVHKALLASGLLARVSGRASEHLLNKLLNYGFILGILLILGVIFLPALRNLHGQTATPDDLATQIRQLHNAALRVELWLDRPGKTQFNSTDQITLYYRVTAPGLARGTPLYLSLFNIAPNGAFVKFPDRYIEQPVKAGETYSIPRLPGEDEPPVAAGVRLRLHPGEEYFKALATSDPIHWKIFLEQHAQKIHSAGYWGTGSLTIKVNPQ